MNKKMSKRQKDLKSKLMAAICMLLVSSIMMVSTTYAWFTLSTAPEVTGITTAVGANGNLEMALLPADQSASPEEFGITTGTPGAALNQAAKNITWGNLVDLSDNTTYGLDKISMYPSELNVATEENGNPTQLAALLLKTPTYGADGRVSELVANTTTSTYVVDGFPQNSYYGVRAVGTASGMTERQLAYVNARSAAATAASQAKNNAKASLSNNGAALADIAMAYGVDSNATFTSADVERLLAIVDALLGSDDETGIIGYIENAYMNYILAYGASGLKNGEELAISDLQFKAFQSLLKNKTVYDLATSGVTGEVEGTTVTVSLPSEMTGAINKLAATKENVLEARTKLSALAGQTEGITFDQIKPALTLLADTDAMKVNNFEIGSIMENVNGFAQSVISGGGGLTVVMETGGGVYADIADHCGDYTAGIIIKEVKYGTLELTDVPANMNTATKVNPSYLSVVGTAVSGIGAPSSAGGEKMPITDTFGYIIDLGFRTNAASSNLLLQTLPANRIYDGSDGSEETMGAGSTMSFTSATADFTQDDVLGLMEAIRIVFFDPFINNVLATAKLDLSAGDDLYSEDGKTVEAPIYLYTNTAATTETTYSYREAEEGEPATHYETAENSGVFKAVADWNSEDGEAPEATHVQVTTTNTVEAGTSWKRESTDAVITPLGQNAAKAVSVLVYLDGNYVDNSNVAATGASSATGTMNLQFASSANLVPMKYTPLMNQSGGTPETTAAATEPTT